MMLYSSFRPPDQSLFVEWDREKERSVRHELDLRGHWVSRACRRREFLGRNRVGRFGLRGDA